MLMVCGLCHLTLRDGEPHEEDFCRGIVLARQVAERGEFTGQDFVVDGALFEQFRDAWAGLTDATADELTAGLRPDAWVSARQRVAARRQNQEPTPCEVLHTCGHQEEHLLEGTAAERKRQRGQLEGELCFFCTKQDEYNEARAAAELRRLPPLVAESRRATWWGEICREQVLRECERHLAELEAECRAVTGRLQAEKTVRGPDCTGCETREDYDAAFAEWDRSLTGEEKERMDAEDMENSRLSEPYFDRMFNAEEALHELAEVVVPDFWIEGCGRTGKQVLDELTERLSNAG